MSVNIFPQTGVLKGKISLSSNLSGKLSTALPDGGFERGYAEGYTKGYKIGNTEGYTKGHEDGVGQGYADGFEKGYSDGLSARTYEVWTITLVDGTVVEKEVALL